jgi:hypothetical protein
MFSFYSHRLANDTFFAVFHDVGSRFIDRRILTVSKFQSIGGRSRGHGPYGDNAADCICFLATPESFSPIKETVNHTILVTILLHVNDDIIA